MSDEPETNGRSHLLAHGSPLMASLAHGCFILEVYLKVEVEKLGNARVKLSIEIPAETVNEELERNYKTLRSQVAVPGFRKGRVPTSILKARFGDHIKAEVIQNLVPPAFEEALKSEQLLPIGSPKFNPPVSEMVVAQNQALAFEVEFDIKPDFELPAYDSLEINKSPANVSREEVEKHIRSLQEEHATYTPIEVDRPVAENDCVRIDWECLVDGELLPDAQKKDEDVELGKGRILPEIEVALMQMRVGETKSVAVNFDENHENPELAGKQTVFNVTVHAITEKQLPALDDEFAKDLEYENYQQMHGAIWNDMVERQKEVREQEQRREVVDRLIEKTPFDVPESVLNEYVERTTSDFLTRLKREGNGTEGIDVEQFKANLRTDAIRETKRLWLFEEIAEAENIHVSDDELDLEVRRIAERQNRDVERYRELLEAANRLEELRHAMRDEKVYDFLVQHARAKQSLIISG